MAHRNFLSCGSKRRTETHSASGTRSLVPRRKVGGGLVGWAKRGLASAGPPAARGVAARGADLRERLIAERSATMARLVAEEADHFVGGETLSAVQEGQFDRERAGHDLGADFV